MQKAKLVDLRIRRTHKLLLEALTELLAEKDFEDITVTALCNRAMINRATFYKHYVDKYELIQEGFHTFMDDLAKKIDSSDTYKEKASVKTTPKHLLFLFEHIKENEKFYSLLLHRSTFNMLRGFFVEWLNKQSQLRMKTSMIKTGDVPTDIATHYAVGALIELINWWIENKMPYSPEEMARFVAEMYKRQFVIPPITDIIN